MLKTRVIPVLLIKDGGLIKTIGFGKEKYVGDPINAIRIFNEKEVDELVLLDIMASKEKRNPPFERIEEVVSECFMPLCFGGGVNDIEDMSRIFGLGIEKIALNHILLFDLGFLKRSAEQFGSQSVVASIDVKKNLWGNYKVYSHVDGRTMDRDPIEFAREIEEAGAGEIFLNSVDMDGTFNGYDLRLVKDVSEAVDIPVIACGGAGTIADLRDAAKIGGASAVAAGSMFVFHGKHRAVLINYPSYRELEREIV